MSRKKNRNRRARRHHRRRANFQRLESRQVLTTSLPIDVSAVGASDPTNVLEFNDLVYFVADDGGEYGRELWATDGTTAGTYVVADINEGDGSSTPAQLTVVGDTLYFVADDGENGRELWMTDGTESGTVMVSDIAEGTDVGTGDPVSSSVYNLTEFDGELYFAADDGEHGVELWKTDGTDAGTVMVHDINTEEVDGDTTASSQPLSLTVVGDTLYFSADDGVNGRELWRTDGTSGGTRLVADIAGGSTNDTANSGAPVLLTAVGDELYFVANDGETGDELWKSDGTASGTILVEDLNEGAASAFTIGDTIGVSDKLIEVDGVLFFTADDGENGNELWVSDGTASGTFLVKDINPGDEGDLYFYTDFIEYDGKLYFSADDGENGRELWVSDGTESGTVMVTDIAPGDTEVTDEYGYTTDEPASSWPYDLAVIDGVLYFSASSPDDGRELWMTDGTEGGTELVANTGVDKIGSYPTDIVGLDGQIFFVAITESEAEVHTLVDDDSFYLTVMIDSEVVEIPHSIGVESDGATAETYTLTGEGVVLFDDGDNVTLGDFFDTWRTDAGEAGENEDAVFSSTEILGYEVDGTNSIQMFVNGYLVDVYEDYEVADGDDVVIVYGSNTVVSLVTTVGAIIIELYEDDTPGTVENFLDYVNSGDYIDSIIHRSDPGFVIQGGGYTTDDVEYDGVDGIDEIDTDDPIENEPGISNTRGTVAMAKLSGDPDSATSQWFVNLSDDNVFLDEEANNAFTVFGQVVSMRTVDNIAQAPIEAADSPFSELPLNGDELIVVTSIEGQGDITGVKYVDLDGDGNLDSSDEVLAGIRVYIDENENGEFDAGETFTFTDEDGRYLLQAEPGTYTVAAETLGGEATTDESDTVTIEIGEVEVIDFGEELADAPTDLTLVAASDTGVSNADGVTNLNNADAGSTLQFTVAGAPAGYEVYVYADGTLIGIEAVADSGPITITTDGATALADGEYEITASFVVGGLETELSEAITVVIDTQAPGAITTDLPEELQVGQDPLDVDLDSPDEGSDGVTYSLVGAPAGMTIDADTGELDWAPTADQTVPTTVDVVLTDTAGNETVLVYDVAVLGVVAARYDEYDATEDEVLVVDVSEAVIVNDDNNGEGDPLEVELVDGPENGAVTLNADGTFTYTPDPNFFGVDTFTYQPINSDESNVAVVTINVAGVPDPPAPEDDAYSVDEDRTLTVSAGEGVLANDFDPDGDTLTATLGAGASNGTLDFDSDGSFTYTPDENFNGVDSFTYTVSDGVTTSDPVTVTLTVNAVNDAPIAADDEYTVSEDGVLTVSAVNGVLANDFDVEGADLEVTAFDDDDVNGDLTVNADGSLTYEPDDDFFGEVTFTYQVSDGSDLVGVGTVTIDVTPESDDPVAEDDVYTGINNGGAFTTLNVLDNDSDPDGDDTFEIVSVTQGSLGGVVTISSNGLWIEYTSPSGEFGEETFTYTIEDEDGLTSTATVTVDLTDVGTAILSGYTYLDYDGDGVHDDDEIGIPGVLVSLTGVSNSGEEVSLLVMTDMDGAYEFVDVPAGSYSLTQQQPQAFKDGAESTPIDGAEIDNDIITSIVVSSGDELTENNFGEQSLRTEFVSIAWFFASNLDSRTELLLDAMALAEEAAGNTELATAIRDLDADPGEDPENTAPDATADAYTTGEDESLSITASEGLLANDVDAEDDALSVTVIASTDNGLLTVLSDGSFAYQPNDDFNGTDTFTYIASDGLLQSGETTVTITVEAINDAPVGEDDQYEANTDGTLTVGAEDGLLANDTDVDGDTLAISTSSTPDNGTLDLETDGSFTYTPDEGFEGEDTFTYTVIDGELISGTVEVTIFVDSINDSPDAVADSYEIVQGDVLTVNAVDGLLANDSDVNADDISIATNSTPSNGALVLDPDGSFVYTPDEGFEGEDTFTYSITDGELTSQTVAVTIVVTPIEDFEVAEDAEDGDLIGTLATPAVLTEPVVYELYDENTAEQLLLAADDHLTGDTSAQVVIVEYLDLACPACKAAHELIEDLLEEYPENVLVVRRHLPLTTIHPNALEAAYAAEAAAAQGYFDEYVDLLFANQGELDQWDAAADPTSLFVSYADDIPGIDVDQFIDDLDSSEVRDRVARDMDAAAELGLTATPSLFLGGAQVSAPSTLDGYVTLVESAIDSFERPFAIDRATGQIFVDSADLLDFDSAEPIEFQVRAVDESGQSVIIQVQITFEGAAADTASLIVESDLDDALGETEDWLLAL